jgi:hypothetical protein
MEKMSESKFNMWRSCVAAAHLDGVVTPEEKQWVEEKIQKLPLTLDQKAILNEDLKKVQNFEECFSLVTDKKDLAFLLNTLRVIGHLDKSFSEIEKQKFQNLEAIVLKGLNLKNITAEVEAMEIESYHENEVYKNHSGSTFEKISNSFMKYANPGEHKFPNKKN